MAERRDLGSGGGGGCRVRSPLWIPAGLQFPHAQLRPGPRARCPACALAPCGTQGLTGLCAESAGSQEGLRSRRRSYAGSGATVAHANAQPCGLAQTRPPAPGRCRSLEGASPAPSAPPPPSQRSRPQQGCHYPLAPGAEDRAPPAAPASEGATDRMQEGPSTFHSPLTPSGKGRGLTRLRGQRGEWPWRSGSCAYASVGLTLGRTEVGATEGVG